jgi:hypothetical protein
LSSNGDVTARRARWRGRRSLGWIPFASGRAIMLVGDTATHVKRRYRLWRSRPIGGRIKAGSFAQDARGRWYLSLAVDIAETRNCGIGEIGIDLALMTLATLSDGRKIGSPRHFNKYQALLAKAQRASKKKRVLIQNYGLFWRRALIHFGAGKNAGHLKGKLIGAKRDDPVDFRDQQGVYCLYDDSFRLVYVGQAGGKNDQRLFDRLKQHREDFVSHRFVDDKRTAAELFAELQAEAAERGIRLIPSDDGTFEPVEAGEFNGKTED